MYAKGCGVFCKVVTVHVMLGPPAAYSTTPFPTCYLARNVVSRAGARAVVRAKHLSLKTFSKESSGRASFAATVRGTRRERRGDGNGSGRSNGLGHANKNNRNVSNIDICVNDSHETRGIQSVFLAVIKTDVDLDTLLLSLVDLSVMVTSFTAVAIVMHPPAGGTNIILRWPSVSDISIPFCIHLLSNIFDCAVWH